MTEAEKLLSLAERLNKATRRNIARATLREAYKQRAVLLQLKSMVRTFIKDDELDADLDKIEETICNLKAKLEEYDAN